MRIARIFDLIDADQRSPQMESELKDASVLWGAPSEDVFAMMIWLKMLAENGDYLNLIKSLRLLFERDIESIEATEDAYRALPSWLVLEPLHSQGLASCIRARQCLMKAINSLNSQYERNQDFAPENLLVDGTMQGAESRHAPSPFQDLHTAILKFYNEIDDVDDQIADIRKIAKDSATQLIPILAEAKNQLEEKRANQILLKQQMVNIRRAIARKKSLYSDPNLFPSRTQIENDRHLLEIREFERNYDEHGQQLREARAEIIRQDMQMKQYETLFKKWRFGEEEFNIQKGEEFTMQQIAFSYKVSQQSVSRRILLLIGEGLLDGIGREGRKHKVFSRLEVAIITNGWPSRRARKA